MVLTHHRHGLQAHRGQCISQCQFESIEVNLKYYISPHLLAGLRQCFIDTYARGVLVVAKVGESWDPF